MNNVQIKFNNLFQQAMTEIKANHIDKATALVNQILNDSEIMQLAKDHPEVKNKLNHLSIRIKQLNQEFDKNEKLPVDMMRKIMDFSDKQTLGQMAQTSSKYVGESAEIVIKRMNESKDSLKEMGFKSAEAAVDYIVNSGKGDQVTTLNLSGLEVTSDQLKLLGENCPNLQHLTIGGWRGKVSKGEDLSCLQKFPKLLTLNISGLSGLNRKALDNLKYTPELTTLILSETIRHLDRNALENLQYTRKLEVLVLSDSGPNLTNLEHLKHTPDLKELYVSESGSLGVRALKNLKHVRKLRRLEIQETYFKEKALDNLKHTPDLEWLNVYGCEKEAIEIDQLGKEVGEEAKELLKKLKENGNLFDY